MPAEFLFNLTKKRSKSDALQSVEKPEIKRGVPQKGFG